MFKLILAILITIGTGGIWFLTLASDPSNTQASKDAANSVAMVGLPIAALFYVAWWFDW